MNNKGVAVVGYGPTGAFTARAAYDLGYQVTIYSHGTPNATPPGAFWLHWVPEDVSGEFSPVSISIIGKGKEENYTRLQWGEKWFRGLTSSFPKKPVSEQGYNPAEVLPRLVPDEVKVEMLTYPLSDVDVDDLARGYDFVFQTFPRREHIEAQPARLRFVAAARFGAVNPSGNVVVYNGTGKGLAVREAYLFGNHFVEYPKGLNLGDLDDRDVNLEGFRTLELMDLDPSTKPVVWEHPSKKVYLMGRAAQWDRKCLSHDCYHRTLEVLRHG